MAKLLLLVLLALVGATIGGIRNQSDVSGIRSRQPKFQTEVGKSKDVIIIKPAIINGEEAEIGEFPCQISLQATNRFGEIIHNCGGAIYNENTIITAAHCVKGYEPMDLRVVAGDHDIFIVEGQEQIRNVSSYIYHPYFDDKTLDNDTAVIKLANPLIFNDRVQPIRLAQSNEEPKIGECVNPGWGNTNPTNPTMAEKLQKVHLDMVDRATCSNQYTEINIISDGMICAGRPGGYGSCNGDSGGPLICKTADGVNFLAGIVSWGIQPCGQDQFPSVYANVAHFFSWIIENV